MKTPLTIFSIIIALLLFSASDFAATRTSSQTGLWNSTSTWGGASVPTTGDDATISAGHTVTLDISPTVTNCTVNGTGILDASTFTLTVSGTFTLANGSTFKQGGTVTAIPGSVKSIGNSSTYVYNGTQNTIPVATSFGNLTWSSSVASAGPAASLSVNGNLTLLNCNELYGAFSSNSATHTVVGNVVIDGGTAALVGKNSSGAGDVTWNIGGNVTTQNGGTLRAFSGAASSDVFFSINGNFANTGAFDIGTGSGVSTMTFSGSALQSFTGNDLDAQNVVINNAAGVNLGTVTLGVTGTLTLTSGALTNSTHLLLYSGSSISCGGGTLTSAQSFPTGIGVTYTANVTTGNELPTSSGDLGDLTINTAGSVTLGAAATVNGILTFTSGKLTLGTHDLSIGSTPGTISGANSAKYIVTNSTGRVIKNIGGAFVYPVGTASTYNPLTLDNTGGVADDYSVRVAASTANVASSASVVGDQWTINEASVTGSNIVLTAQWNAGEEGATFASSRTSGVVARYTGAGTAWTNFGTTVTGSGPYTAQTTSAITNNFSNSVFTVGLPGVFPVELTSFNATGHNGKVELSWKTATETNNYGFEVERRSMNNQQLTLNGWQKIAFVEGHGTTSAPQSYAYSDESARVGKYSYRLKQIDRDGKFIFHPEVEVAFAISPSTVWLENNYPNPFNPSTTISFVLGTTGKASLKIFNILGQEVVTLANGEFTAGEVQTFTFDASRIASGIYYYQLKSGDKTAMKKMMLLK